MIPDDHDIRNNLDREFLEDDRKILTLAGRQAFYEYQYQLKDDIYNEKGNFSTNVLNDEIYFTQRIGPFGIFYLDTR
jgi:hypothetical protein